VLDRPIEGIVGDLFPAGNAREVRPIRELLEEQQLSHS
jgi:hypothetical protein